MCRAKISWLFVSNPHFSHTRRCPSFSNLDIKGKQLAEKHLLPYAYSLPIDTRRRKSLPVGWDITTNKITIILGVASLAVALVTAPMPLNISLPNSTRTATIYPNLLFAVPLLLLAALLLLYGAVASDEMQTNNITRQMR